MNLFFAALASAVALVAATSLAAADDLTTPITEFAALLPAASSSAAPLTSIEMRDVRGAGDATLPTLFPVNQILTHATPPWQLCDGVCVQNPAFKISIDGFTLHHP